MMIRGEASAALQLWIHERQQMTGVRFELPSGKALPPPKSRRTLTAAYYAERRTDIQPQDALALLQDLVNHITRRSRTVHNGDPAFFPGMALRRVWHEFMHASDHPWAPIFDSLAVDGRDRVQLTNILTSSFQILRPGTAQRCHDRHSN